MAKHSKRKRQKRQKKTYDLKVLQEKWALERFDEKKYQARIATVVALICAACLLVMGILTCVFVPYTPIAREDATYISASYNGYHTYHRRGRESLYLMFTDRERLLLSRAYTNNDLKDRLAALDAGTEMQILLSPDNEIIEIKAAETEILNFDHAQKKLQRQGIFYFAVGILICAGSVMCGIYAFIKICKEKVFAPSKSIYGRK